MLDGQQVLRSSIPCAKFHPMRELVRSNDMVLVSYIVDLLQQEGLAAVVFDVHMSILEGSVGVLPRRVMVAGDDELRARRLVAEAGLRDHLSKPE